MQASEANARGEDKKRRRVYVDKISVYLTDSHVWWEEKLTSTVTKEVAVPFFFFLLFPRASSLLARLLARITLAHAIILTPLLVKKLASLQTIHHSAKIVIVSPKQTICIPL